MTTTVQPPAESSARGRREVVLAVGRVLLLAAAVLAGGGPASAEEAPTLHIAIAPGFPPIPSPSIPDGQRPSPALDREVAPTRPALNVVVPIVEAGIFNAGMWAIDRYALDADFARVTARSVAANLRGGWSYDTDDYQTNQIMHPYQGSVYHTAARSAGWGFWGALALDFCGSLAWKIAGENGPPSINDQIMTPMGGAVLGEVLFRLSHLVFDRPDRVGFGRWLGSLVIAPATAVNEVVLDGRIADPDPLPQQWLGRVSLGASTGSAVARTGAVNIPSQGFIGLHLVHGLPGEVELSEPFDHFDVQLDFSSATPEPWNELGNAGGPAWLLSARGLIFGRQERLGEDGAILYGVFGTFDYGGPQLLRVSATGLGPGVALATRPAPSIVVDATVLASATFGSGGAFVPREVDRDFRYGFGGLLLAEGRVWLAGRLELAASARGFLVPAAVGGGGEGFLLGKGSARLRIVGSHAIGVETTLSRRWADYAGSAYEERARFTTLAYSYLFGGPRRE